MTMKNYFEYKGYVGRVEMSEEDGIFCGTIYGINDLVTFEADNFKDLKLAFEEAVDDYLIFCEECGKTPEKMYKGQFNIRISPELHRALAIESFKQNVSLNQIVEQACNEFINDKKCNCNLSKAMEEHLLQQFKSSYNKSARNDFGWKQAPKNLNFRFMHGGVQ